MVLTLADVPTGFALDRAESGWRSNARVAAETSRSKATLDRWGRITGYEVTFLREGSLKALSRGAVSITSEASLYKDGKGAHRLHEDDVRQCDKAPFKRLSLAERIGDEALLCAATIKVGRTKAVTYALFWRRGAIYASVIAFGVPGGIDATEVIPLAQKQDERIRAAT